MEAARYCRYNRDMRSVTALRLLAGALPSLVIVLAVGCRGEKRSELKESDKGLAAPGSPSSVEPMDACKTAMTNLGDGTGGRFEAAATACGAACERGHTDACKFLEAAKVVHSSAAATAAPGAGSAAGSGSAGSAAGSGAGSGSATARVADPKMIEAAKKGGTALDRQQERGKQKATSNVESGSRAP